MNEAPAALRRAEPEVPILPVGERDVVPAGVAPHRAAYHGAGVDVVAPEHPRQIELRHGDAAGPRAELAAIAVDHAYGGIDVELRHRLGCEAGEQAVVGVER